MNTKPDKLKDQLAAAMRDVVMQHHARMHQALNHPAHKGHAPKYAVVTVVVANVGEEVCLSTLSSLLNVAATKEVLADASRQVAGERPAHVSAVCACGKCPTQGPSKAH